MPALRERLGLDAKPDEVYDRALADAVAAFQKEHKLPANGQLTQATAGRAQRRAPRPHARHRRHSSPTWSAGAGCRAISARTDVDAQHSGIHAEGLSDHGAVVWQTRVVVGKLGDETPLLSETMKYITVNPTWNVPQSIVYNELLPTLSKIQPSLRARMKVEHNRDGSVHIFAAARRAQRARPHPLQLPEQVPGLSARHAGQEPVRVGEARVQPRLHAGTGSGEVRRGDDVAWDDRRLTRRTASGA